MAHIFGVNCHRLSLRLPKFEMYETGSQLRRAAKSVSANIVEGYGRRDYKNEFLKFLIYAHSSCDESCEHLLCVSELHPEFVVEAEKFQDDGQELGRKMHRFIQAVRANHRSLK